MMKKSLGRGLSSIIGDVSQTYAKEFGLNLDNTCEINIDLIQPNPFQPRKKFNEESLKELSASIKEYGLIQPIILLKKSNNSYILIAGERRLKACKMLDFTTIKSLILDTDENRLRELALIENIQREDLNPIDLANSYKILLDKYNITQENLANMIYKSRSQITNTLRLLNLDERTQKLILDGKISQGHAKILVGLSKEQERKIVDSIIGQKLSVNTTEQFVRQIKNNKKGDKNLQKELEKLKMIFNEKKLKYKIRNNTISISIDNIEKIKILLDLFK